MACTRFYIKFYSKQISTVLRISLQIKVLFVFICYMNAVKIANSVHSYTFFQEYFLIQTIIKYLERTCFGNYITLFEFAALNLLLFTNFCSANNYDVYSVECVAYDGFWANAC